MRAWEIGANGGNGGLRLVTRPDPVPGPGQVLVRVHAASLNYRDLLVVGGMGRWQSPPGRIPLSDGAGDAIAVGSGVSRVKIGDRVAGIFEQGWIDGGFAPEKTRATLGSPGLDGVLSELRVFDEQGLVALPDHLRFEEAATLPCAGVTAWHALVETARVQPGDTVLVQGTGGVSVFAIQLARMAGARVIVISRSGAKLERARTLGAAEVVDTSLTSAWDEAVLELTGGRGVDHVVDVAGAASLNRSIRAVRAGGVISVIGVLDGFAAGIDTLAIMAKALRLQGIQTGSREMFEALNRALAAHSLHPVLDTVFEFEDAPSAIERLSRGAHFGKICVRILPP